MDQQKITLFITVLSLFSCQYEQHHEYIDYSIKVDSHNIPLSKDQYYFPVKLFPIIEMKDSIIGDTLVYIKPVIIENSVDSFGLKWFSHYLFGMHEPLLFNRPTKKEIFRFLWLRALDYPIVVRLEKEKDKVILIYKVTRGEDGCDAGPIVKQGKTELSLLEWNKFIELVNKENFWEMQRSTSYGIDGAEWILEGVGQSKYHVVTAWSPGEASGICQICNYLLEKTKLEIREEDKY